MEEFIRSPRGPLYLFFAVSLVLEIRKFLKDDAIVNIAFHPALLHGISDPLRLGTEGMLVSILSFYLHPHLVGLNLIHRVTGRDAFFVFVLFDISLHLMN